MITFNDIELEQNMFFKHGEIFLPEVKTNKVLILFNEIITF